VIAKASRDLCEQRMAAQIHANVIFRLKSLKWCDVEERSRGVVSRASRYELPDLITYGVILRQARNDDLRETAK
jgi:hypothetical protein